jgi:hypothetical protein
MSDTIRCPECGHWFYLQNPITCNTDHLVRDVIAEALNSRLPEGKQVDQSTLGLKSKLPGFPRSSKEQHCACVSSAARFLLIHASSFHGARKEKQTALLLRHRAERQ